jgi:hypothetical protein
MITLYCTHRGCFTRISFDNEETATAFLKKEYAAGINLTYTCVVGDIDNITIDNNGGLWSRSAPEDFAYFGEVKIATMADVSNMDVFESFYAEFVQQPTYEQLWL